MSNSSTITAPSNEISSAGSRKSSSTTGVSRFSLNLLIQYIEHVLSAITDQGLDCTIIHSGTELRDLVQPVASDFSKLFEGISEGAKMFSDQKFLKSQLSTEAHSIAVDVLKGLGNAHWVAVGLLAIANVLERFDNISANDRECIDLLKAMLKLGKYLKQMKDLNVKLHEDILDDMREAVQLIVSGAILCRSFITSNKLSKFLLTKKIRDELVYVRGKVNAMKADLMGHMQLLIMKTVTFIHEQYITGRIEENNCLAITEQYQSEDTQCEMEQSCKTELDGSESDTISFRGEDNCNEINGYKQLEKPLRSSFQLGKFLRKMIPTVFRRRPKLSPHLELQMLVNEIQPSQIEFKRDELDRATKGFSKRLGKGGFGTVYRGNLSDGRQVAVKIFQYKTEWMNVLRTVGKLQHRNIRELVGYCFDNMMLVYDYMPGNLNSVIYGEDEMIIDWPTRHNIILDIIRGLAYLHEGARVCIVHRDIKPSNILLDENLNAKICDFDVAQILHPSNVQYANKEISTDGGGFLENITDFSSHETTVVGTVGYLDPEYYSTNCVTLKSDIYSFGVLLLNVVSGKQTIFHIRDEMHSLVNEAWNLNKEDRLTELIDPRLLNTEGLINSSRILRTLRIALCCIQETSERRPPASRLLKMLSSEEEISIPTSPLQSPYYHSEDEISICNSSSKTSIVESSIADDHSPEQDIPIPTTPVDDHFLEEKIPIPTLPLESSSADDNFSQEEIPLPTPPIKSFVADDHCSEEKISTSTPPLESSEEEIHHLNPQKRRFPFPPTS